MVDRRLTLWGLVAITSVTLFGLFCCTVRAFPGGLIRIEGPWGIRLEAQLGDHPTQNPSLSPSDRK